MRPKPLFNVGDQVCIVSAKDCIYGCNDQMLEFVNCEGTILSRYWESPQQAYAYRLDIDDNHFMWCEKCLAATHLEDIEESSENLDVLLS